MTWNRHLKYKALETAVDKFISAFVRAKSDTKDTILLDRLTTAFIKLERARERLKKWERT